jgi:hypothetical protein
MSKIPYYLLVLVAGCQSEAPVEMNAAPDSDAAPAAILDVSRCWQSEPRQPHFRGALAIYRKGDVVEAIPFTSKCGNLATFDDMRKSLRVRVRCVRGIADLKHCGRSAPQLDERLFDPGVSPEFPTDLYAFEGRLSEPAERGDDYLIFDALEVVRYQHMPKETFAAFLFYPEDRKDYIDSYLRPHYLDEKGYKKGLEG